MRRGAGPGYREDTAIDLKAARVPEADLPFPDRIRRRRDELGWTRSRLAEQTAGLLSASAVKQMENPVPGKRYHLPRRLASGKKPPAIEVIASALDVPLGYLLAGFEKEEVQSSIYGSQVTSGRILLQPLLRPQQDETFRSFLNRLPNTETELLNLPLNSYYNQFAFGVIFRIEKLYPGFEMLLVNELPLIFWDKEDVETWVSNMNLDDGDKAAFRTEFARYRDHFRKLAKSRAKRYKVVLNYATLNNFLRRKDIRARKAQFDDITEFMRLPSFDMVIYRPAKQPDPEIARPGYAQQAHEAEVLCRQTSIPASLDQTISVQILQTSPQERPVSYFVSPAPKSLAIIAREIGRINRAFANALEQYRLDLSSTGSITLNDAVVKEHTLVLLASVSAFTQVS